MKMLELTMNSACCGGGKADMKACRFFLFLTHRLTLEKLLISLWSKFHPNTWKIKRNLIPMNLRKSREKRNAFMPGKWESNSKASIQ